MASKEEEMMKRPLSLGRLYSLSDGIFAIVITILVLGLDMPKGHDFAGQGVWAFFGKIEDQLLPYCVSFTLIASYWVLHHVILNYMARCDRTFVWLNLFFMLPLSLAPWVTGIRSLYPNDLNVAMLFGIVQMANYLLLLIIWHYGLWKLRNDRIPAGVIVGMDLRIGIAVLLNVVGVMLVPFSEHVSTFVFICTPLIFIQHRSVDRHHIV